MRPPSFPSGPRELPHPVPLTKFRPQFGHTPIRYSSMRGQCQFNVDTCLLPENVALLAENPVLVVPGQLHVKVPEHAGQDESHLVVGQAIFRPVNTLFRDSKRRCRCWVRLTFSRCNPGGRWKMVSWTPWCRIQTVCRLGISQDGSPTDRPSWTRDGSLPVGIRRPPSSIPVSIQCARTLPAEEGWGGGDMWWLLSHSRAHGDPKS